MEKTTSLGDIGRVLTLVGSIVESVFGVIITVVSLGIGFIAVGPIIALSWVARDKTLKGSQGWNIYGIIHGCMFNWLTAAGHIVLLVSKITSNIKDEGWTITISKNDK